MVSVLRWWTYRSRQFFVALFGKVTSDEIAEAHSVLSPRLYSLFAAMPQQYRRHALTVYNRVKEAGCDDATILQAALLHDCGKYDPASGLYVTIFHRVAVVLLDALPGGKPFMRGLLRRGRERGPILYPFYLSRNHAILGAKLAARHGASDELAHLIAHHHEYSGQNRSLLALQAADDKS